MEPITQGLLGAAVGQAGWRGTLGRRALLWGAVVGILPDLDVIFVGLHRGFGEMLYHRGTSHSLWFGFVVGPLFGGWLWRRGGRSEPFGAWAGLCIAALVTHPLLDAFTPYGTQLFAPFDRMRVAWQGVGIIDPFYTVMLAAAVVWGARRSVSAHAARLAAVAALLATTAYLLLGVWANQRAAEIASASLQASDRSATTVRAYPTILQPFLRHLVARGPGWVRVGLHTPFGDGTPRWADEHAIAPASPALRDLQRTWEGQIFHWFALEETVGHERQTPRGTLVEIEDLRYVIPGLPAGRGMWGIRALYDAAGQRKTEVARYNRRRIDRPAMLLAALWSAAWGDYSGVTEIERHGGAISGGTGAPAGPAVTLTQLEPLRGDE